MELLEEINLRENLEESLFRQWMATPPGPDGIAARETIYLQVMNLEQTFDMMRLEGGKSGQNGGPAEGQ